jgi:hypothetical protein
MPFSFLHVLLKPQTMPLSHALFAFLLFLLPLGHFLDWKLGIRCRFSSRERKRDGFFVPLWILGEFDSENSSDPRKQAFSSVQGHACSIAREAASDKAFRRSPFWGMFWEDRKEGTSSPVSPLKGLGEPCADPVLRGGVVAIRAQWSSFFINFHMEVYNLWCDLQRNLHDLE